MKGLLVGSLLMSVGLCGCGGGDVPAKTTVWSDVDCEACGGADEVRYERIYMAWPDGGSLAFIIPVKQPTIEANRAVYEDWMRWPVQVAVEEGAVYHDGVKLVDFPAADNRYYILGKDLKLHDSGQSAEWLMLPMDRVGAAHGVVVDVQSGGNAKTWSISYRPQNGAVRGGVVETPDGGFLDIPFGSPLSDERQSFFALVTSLAFDGDLVYGAAENSGGSNGRIRKSGGDNVHPGGRPGKWQVLPLANRPSTWKPAYPRDDWAALLTSTVLGFSSGRPDAMIRSGDTTRSAR